MVAITVAGSSRISRADQRPSERAWPRRSTPVAKPPSSTTTSGVTAPFYRVTVGSHDDGSIALRPARPDPAARAHRDPGAHLLVGLPREPQGLRRGRLPVTGRGKGGLRRLP